MCSGIPLCGFSFLDSRGDRFVFMLNINDHLTALLDKLIAVE